MDMTWKNKLLPVLFMTGSLIMGASGWAETAKTSSGAANPDSGTLAIIEGKSITLDNFKAEMARQGGEFDSERKEALLDSMVRGELLFSAARAAKYENDPEVIAAVKQIMVGKYLRDTLDPKLALLKASDQEAEAYYQAHQAEFGAPAMVHAALIRIAVPPRASEEKKAELQKRAKNARAEALALEPGVPAFGGVAVNYSEDQDSRYRGGDVGWLRVGEIDGRWDKKVSDAILALKNSGQVSPLIDAADGYYIVKLIDTKKAMVKPLNAVKDGVLYHVVQEKKKKLEQELIAQLKKQMPVSVNSGLLKTIALPNEGKKPEPPALPAR